MPQPLTSESRGITATREVRAALWLIAAAVLALLISAWDQAAPSTDRYDFTGQPVRGDAQNPMPTYARVADPTLSAAARTD